MRMPRPTLLPFIGLVALVSCASAQKLTGGALAPAASGTVDAKIGEGGNTQLEVKVEHLAPPEKVSSGATVYVVWVIAKDAPAVNVGDLKLNADLDGSLQTVTPQHAFELKITAESVSTASNISGPVVLSGSVVAK
jgi:hypothetical protein